jgi:phage terminase small subunit
MKKTRGADGRTDMERRFIVEYLIDFNATRAYIAAAAPRKITPRTASTNGARLLALPEIVEAIRKERDTRMSAAGITLNETLLKLRQITMYDVRKLFTEEGAPKGIHELDDDTAAAIVGIKPSLVGMEYKMADRVAAVEKAMKYHGLYEKDNEQKKDDLTDLVEFLAERGTRIVPKPQP